MKKLFAVASAAFLGLFLLAGCEASTDDLADGVKASMEEKFKKDPDTKNVKVRSLTLVHKSGNQYTGIATLDDGKETADATVDVTYDGNSFMWEIKE